MYLHVLVSHMIVVVPVLIHYIKEAKLDRRFEFCLILCSSYTHVLTQLLCKGTHLYKMSTEQTIDNIFLSLFC